MTVNPIADRAFGSQAEAYERGRPGWPAETVASLLKRWGARDVVDLGRVPASSRGSWSSTRT